MGNASIQSALGPGSRPGFNICLGPDSVLLKEHIEALLAAHTSGVAASTNTSDVAANTNYWEKYFFWGDEPLENGFWEKLAQQSLFDQPRAVILRQAQSKLIEKSGDLKKISAALSRANEHIWPFICFEVPYKKGKIKIPAYISKLQCVSFAQKQGWYKEIPPLDNRSIKKFVQKEAVALNLALSAADWKHSVLLCLQMPAP